MLTVFKTLRSNHAALFLLILCTIMLQACATVPYTGRSQIMMVSPQEENALGLKAAKQVLAKEPVLEGTAEAKLVEDVGKRIAAAARRADFRWEFHLIDRPVVNAFCLPGGKVFVYKGIFQHAATPAELATVMGHEIGHAIARHGAERMSRAMMVQMGGNIAAVAVGVGTGSSAAAQAFGQVYGAGANVGLILPHSRDQELEADRIGLILMAEAGYDPGASISFWQKMAADNSGKRPPEFLSTHPTGPHRIQAIQEFLPEARKHYRAATGGAGGHTSDTKPLEPHPKQ